MDLNQLKTFVTVAETASLTRAAGLLPKSTSGKRPYKAT